MQTTDLKKCENVSYCLLKIQKMQYVITFLVSIVVLFGCSNQQNTEVQKRKIDSNKIKVYLLGTFHFAQTDSTYDVLEEHHQESISELCDIIKRQKPDKVFIERMPDYEYQNKMDSLYQVYINMNEETRKRRNEIWQVAFRVASDLGHSKVYQCDHPGRYGALYRPISEYAGNNNQTDILEYKAKGTSKPITSIIDEDSLMQKLTVLEYLQWLNSKEVQSSSHAHYINVFPQVGQTDVYNYSKDYMIGTELTADWYRRNIYIYSKMINQLDYNEESIFLIMGNDHIPILKHLFESNPYFEFIETDDWLKKG
jgi:uncharacterized protein DUF5694